MMVQVLGGGGVGIMCAETYVCFMRGMLVVPVVLDREALCFDHLLRNREAAHTKRITLTVRPHTKTCRPAHYLFL
jgi:hypothetical protein